MIKATTEVLDQYVRESSVAPDKETRILNKDGVTIIFSLGTDGGLYLTRENENGEEARFSRTKLIDHVISFAAELLDNSQIALGLIVDGSVYVVYTEKPETLSISDFEELDFSGCLGGMKLTPYRLMITALGDSPSLFVEFHDPSGFTQQFAAQLGENSIENMAYYRLASEFTQVLGVAAGRAARQYVDGVYTYGVFHAGDSSPREGFNSDAPQLIYTPCRNAFGNTPPSPIRLKTDAVLEAIASLKKSDNSGTHLFAAGEGKLFFYPHHEQLDWLSAPGKGAAKLIAQDERLLNARQLAAYTLADKVYIFVRTDGGKMYYFVADYHGDNPDKLLGPIDFWDNVMRFDVHDGKVSVFTETSVTECTQNPVTGAFKLDTVAVQTSLDTYRKFTAFSTRIHVDKPECQVAIESISGEKIGFYSEKYYYKTRKAALTSDHFGYVTVVMPTDDITAESFRVSCGEESLVVNPADMIHQKLLSMTKESDFENAQITDLRGNTEPLVPKGKKSRLSAAASGMASLRNSAVGLIPGIDNPINHFIYGVKMSITDKIISILPAALTDNPFVGFVADVVNDICAAFQWVKGKIKELYDKTIGKAIHFVIQKTQKIWKFFIQVGEKVISVIVDCAAKVVEGIKRLLEIIGIPVDKILNFFKKALGLDNVSHINNAIKNLAGLSIDVIAKKSEEMKEEAVELLSQTIDRIENWADIDKEIYKKIEADNPVKKDISRQLSGLGITMDSHNMYVFDLLGGITAEEVLLPKVEMTDTLKSAFEQLDADRNEVAGAVSNISTSMSYLLNELEEAAGDFSFERLLGVLKKMVGIVAADFLYISKALLKTFFDIIIEGIRVLWAAITKPLKIPFLSEVLKLFGVNEFCILDFFTYPTAFFANALNSGMELFGGAGWLDMQAIKELEGIKNLAELKMTGGADYV